MLASVLALAILTPQTPPQEQVIAPELLQVITVAPDEHHRAYVVMDTRMTLADFQGRVEELARGERQRFVMNELRAFADQSQAHVLDVVANLEAQGDISRHMQLWINNSVQFSGNAKAVYALAELGGVERIMYDPDRDPAETQDLPLSLMMNPAPVPNPAAVTYYKEDFESGVFDPEWSTTTSGCGRIQVTSAQGPYAGSFHALMDSTTSSCLGTASMTLTVDLSGVTTAQLRYAFLDLNDELNIGSDILEASDDGGASWTKIADLTGPDGSYTLKTHDLDPLGLSYVSNFMIRFSWTDNFPAPTDGFAFDEIEIADSFPPPPPPTPEPNLVQHQATDLWARGINGDGAVIVNIDSGCDRFHPDLANRIFENLPEVNGIPGVDDDGNGFIDDTWGWNFSLNNNDPAPSGSHGTNTGGIMVGDGSSGGRLTGMAPGAKMGVCRISGESDHMGSQQWSISVGADCNSSSHSYKWPFSPRPDYDMHRHTTDMTLAAGVIHANSIGNQGQSLTTYPIPFNVSAPGNSPGPWRHPQQVQGGVSGVMGCCGIQIGDDQYYDPSGKGPSAWEDFSIYDPIAYPPGTSDFDDYPYGGFGGGQPGLLKPDIAGYTSGPWTTTNGGGYTTFSGTSCATPHVGGAMALLVSANEHAPPRQISQALQENAEDRGAAGKDTNWGSGKMLVDDAASRMFHLVTSLDLEPQLGTLATIHVSGPPGAGYGVFRSFSNAPSPGVNTGGAACGATVDLDIGGGAPVLLFTGVIPAGGLDVRSAFIPNNPALADQVVYLQSAADDATFGGCAVSLVETVTLRL